MKKLALTIIFISQCSLPLKELSRREEIVKSTDNQRTVIFNQFYLDFLEQTNLNLRFRFIPYIESSTENLNVKHFQNSLEMIFSSNPHLFSKLEKNKFHYKTLIDQYHIVDIDLRYSNKTIENELFYPTVIFMIEGRKLHRGLTSFIGVGLKIFLRFSIFDRLGEEIAYCQKRMNNNIFSNDFLLNIILEEKSPFLTNLNDPNEFKTDTFMKQKINECIEELFKPNINNFYEK